jgi:AraC-like DNA-binding protein
VNERRRHLPDLERHSRTLGHASQAYSESLFIEDVTVDAHVSPSYFLRLVTGVVSKSIYESELAIERTQIVALEIDV